jgi:iron(III) transport system substrate-binding protein
MKRRLLALSAVFAGAVLAQSGPAVAQDRVLNLYSARHYQTDEALYANFTQQTGIRINRIEANDEPLLERLRAEGRNSPADVLLLVDAARLWKAQSDGMFQPVQSNVLRTRIPSELRSPDSGQGSEWFSFSTRARVMVYNKAQLKADDVANYEDLAKPSLRGKVCTRSATHPYMLSLIGAISERLGEAATEQWARGVVANFARTPRGGDTDQIRAVASGECGVALTNTYYLVRLMRSDKPEDREVVSKVAMVWPNQAGVGTHINVSGGGVLKNAPNRENAIKFLEYLASDQAQQYLANGNNEWPVVAGIKLNNPELERLGAHKSDKLDVGTIGRSQVTAARIVDRTGWR